MRLLLHFTLLIGCSALGATPLLAAMPPRVVIGGETVASNPAPILKNGEVFVPLSFRYGTLPITADTDGNEVILRGPGGIRARAPLTTQDGHVYYPIARACPDLQLGARWVEKESKLYVGPCITSVRPDLGQQMLTLRIAAAYPVRYRVERVTNPHRLMLEIPNAQLFTESTTIPLGRAGVQEVRATQSYDPYLVRVVVALESAPRYRALSGEYTTQIRVRLGVPDASGTGPAADIERLLNAPDTEAPLVDVLGVGVEYDDAGNTRIIVRGSGDLSGEVIRLGDPPRLALDLPDAVLRAESPTVLPETPLVRGVRLGQFKENVARVVVDLADEVEFAVSKGPDLGSLVLNLKAGLGLTPVARGLAGLRIMLDPGHGGSLSGTKGLSGRREQDINLDVAKRLYAMLEAAGARPTMTRKGDDTVGLYARPAMANAQKVQVFISIHANANGRPNSARGIETYYAWPHSLPLAQAVHSQLVTELRAPDRKVRKHTPFVVIRETKMPSILVEIGYMNHKEEDRLLGTPEYRQRVARAIFNGIARYAGGGKSLESAEELDDALVSEVSGEER